MASLPDKGLIKLVTIIFNATKPESSFNFKIGKSFSETLHKFNRAILFDKIFDRKYTVCTKRYSLYNHDKCTAKYWVQNAAKCTFIKFPKNYQEDQWTKQWGKLLMRTFVPPSGEKPLYPCVTYCHRSIKESLKLIATENFENNCANL